MRPEPRWLVPAERRAVALALRQTCRAGERVAAPPDIGLYVNALAPCAAYYPLGGYFHERLDELLAFYGQGAPEERLRFLDRRCITQLVLPGEAGEDPQQWLGAGSVFRRTAWIGRGPTAITLYARRGGGPCGPPSP